MNVKDIIFSICNDKGISFSQAAKNMGISKGSLYNQVTRDEGMRLRVETLIRYLDELECEITITDTLTENEYVLDGFEEDIELDRKRDVDNRW